jgi:pimeloyl-ACP methyl ester carboxylesterase
MSTSMTPVRDETLTLNGLRFHYRDWGSPGAPPLVLLHGGLGNARHWDTLAQSLADRYRVLALDQRGHGESARSPRGQYTPDLITGDFAGFVGELRLSRFPIVGFSFGGHVAYTFAAVHPNQVSRLVMVETFVPPATPANIAS